MEIGDSFFLPTIEPTKESANVLTAAKQSGIKVTCRRVEDGLRVWRTA